MLGWFFPYRAEDKLVDAVPHNFNCTFPRFSGKQLQPHPGASELPSQQR